jgi:electron transport complex protein RnfG
MLWESILRNAVGLALFAAVTVGVIAVTQVSTAQAIAEQREAARMRALLEILPEDAFDNAILEDVVRIEDPALGLGDAEEAFLARRGEAVVAVLLPVRVPDGYSGEIRLLLGLRPDGTVAGVRVLEHRETPGLGDKIELRKSDWIRTFEGRSLGDPPAEDWAVRKDGGVFDAFTGATITPRAVVAGIRRALEWYEREGRAMLLDAPGGPETADARTPLGPTGLASGARVARGAARDGDERRERTAP